MFRRPFRDLGWRQQHALEQRAAALEMEMFVAALGRIGGQANRQYQIDHFHCSTLPSGAAPPRRSMDKTLQAGTPKVPNGKPERREGYPLALEPSTMTNGRTSRWDSRNIDLISATSPLACSARMPSRGSHAVVKGTLT